MATKSTTNTPIKPIPNFNQKESKKEPAKTINTTNTQSDPHLISTSTSDRQRRFSSKRSMSAPHMGSILDNLDKGGARLSYSARKPEHDHGFVSELEASRKESIKQLKTTVRKRRKSLMQHSDHIVTTKADAIANFAPLQGSKISEALAITLRRDKEAGRKKKGKTFLQGKYKRMRTDSQAQTKKQTQKQKREKRLAKGKEVKAKDMINKGHEQFVLTWGMMLGVQMSVGRQFEFSAKTSAKNVVETNKNKTSSGNNKEDDEEFHTSKSSLSQSKRRLKQLSISGVAAAIDEETGQVIATPSLDELLKDKTKRASFKTNTSDTIDTTTTTTTNSSSTNDSTSTTKNTASGRRASNLRGDMDMYANSLKVTDFMAVDKYIFPLQQDGMSSHFKFKDYAPLAFRNLRNFWEIDKYEYLYSICNPNTNFLEFMSNSKSGMYFFFSHDKKYMIKTLKDDECRFLRRILPHYVRHMTRNPNSLINRYYGLHRVKMPHLRRKIHFVVMNNIFHTPKPIHTMYDLKGATYHGRYVKKTKITRKSHHGEEVCRKDLNFQGYTNDEKPGSKSIDGQPTKDWRQWLKIGDPKRKLIFADQIAKDSVFLAKMKIMDYSLLIGVHGRDPLQVPGYIPPNKDNQEDDEDNSESEDDDDDADAMSDAYNFHSTEDNENENKVDEMEVVHEENEEHDDSDDSDDNDNNTSNETLPKKYQSLRGKTLETSKSHLNDKEMEVQDIDEDGQTKKNDTDEKGTDSDEVEQPPQIPLSIFQRDDGGFWGMNADGTPNNEIYYVGIIDILQQYNTIKYGENLYKSWFTNSGSSKISALPPKRYAQRFIEFITGSIK